MMNYKKEGWDLTPKTKVFIIIAMFATMLFMMGYDGAVQQGFSDLQRLSIGVVRGVRDVSVRDFDVNTIQFTFTTPTKRDVEMVLHDNYDLQNMIRDKRYNCIDYANYVVSKLREHNIYACNGYFQTEREAGHAIIVVNTRDAGLLYIEPGVIPFRYYPQVIEHGFNYCEYMAWGSHEGCDITKFTNCFEGRVV